MTREMDLAAAFVEIAETMVSGSEVEDSLHLLCGQAVTLLDVTSAGVMLADESDRLHAVAASDEDTHLLELFALQHEEGPCPDVYRTGVIEQISTAGTTARWPHFSEVALAHGYGWVCGLPLRHGGETIGALNLFRLDDTPLSDQDVQLGQALADVVTVSLLQRRETAEARRLAAHLQIALTSRVLIEQAKGALAQQLGLSIDESFKLMRRRARNNNRRLQDVAQDIVGEAGRTDESALEDPPA